MIRFLFFFFLLFYSTSAFCQSDFGREIKFVNHLFDLSEYRNGIKVLNDLSVSSLSAEQQDSLNYYIGWAYYNIKSLDTSAVYFQKVGSQSPLYLKSKFYESFDKLYLGKHDSAITTLNTLSVASELEQLRLLQKGGIYLLERNYKEFLATSVKYDNNYFPVAVEQKRQMEHYNTLVKNKDKSPLLAGTMSAIIPGSGKWYAGYRGKALSSFIQVAVLGGVVAESYYRAGYKSPQFILFSGIFSVFYIGNIWGSVLSVQIKRNEVFKETDNQIMLDLHMPLRRVFN